VDTQEPFYLVDSILHITEWQQRFNVFAGFSTKFGDSDMTKERALNLSYTVGDNAPTVRNNRQLLASWTPVPLEHWVFADQQHTNNIVEVTAADRGKGTRQQADAIARTDGMYTREKGLMLATFHADCTPIYFYAPTHELIGLVHAGWRGTVREITGAFIKRWLALGVDAGDIHIVLGPAAAQANYEVDERVATQVRQMALPDAVTALIERGNGKYLLDTPYLNYLAARHFGVPATNIMRSTYCTIRDDRLFFSYRRSQQTGRMLAFITQ